MIVVKIHVHLANAFKPSQGGKIVGSAGVRTAVIQDGARLAPKGAQFHADAS